MLTLNEIFEPRDDKERDIVAIEALCVSIQLALQRAMASHGVSQKELASRLGVSPARVSQILSSDGANLTVATIAKVARALNEEFDFVRTREKARKPLAEWAAAVVKEDRDLLSSKRTEQWEFSSQWSREVANENRAWTPWIEAKSA